MQYDEAYEEELEALVNEELGFEVKTTQKPRTPPSSASQLPSLISRHTKTTPLAILAVAANLPRPAPPPLLLSNKTIIDLAPIVSFILKIYMLDYKICVLFNRERF